MGTLPLSFEQFSPSKRNRTNKQWQNSQISNLSTLWLPSTSPSKNGTNSPELSPRPLDSHWPRLLPALLNSTTNIAACTLVMMSQFTLSEFVLDDLSKDSVSPPESPRNNV